jgi:SSS family solute:Na+ symporter
VTFLQSDTVERMAETDWLACSYAVVILSLAIVAFVAVIYPTQIAPRLLSKDANMLQDLEGYLTARNSQNKWRIAFSFFAGSVGSWAVTTPASYACFAGWVGMVFYALATGLPIMVIAYFGNLVREKYPTAQALGDMVVLRFGPTLRLCTCIVALFNMAIFMLAEFTTIGSLFKDFVGSVNYPIMIVMAVLTTTYSTYGGLVTSIVTDQIQAVACLTFILVLSIYIWATFKQPLVPGFGDLAPLLGPNDSGYGAIFVMPVSLMAATVFNEGVWQRVWAAQDTQALKQGGIIGGIFLIIALFLLGLFGTKVLAYWYKSTCLLVQKCEY